MFDAPVSAPAELLVLPPEAKGNAQGLCRPHTFLSTARDLGFTPNQAAHLYQQRRMFSQHLWLQAESWPDLGKSAVLAFLEEVNHRLDELTHPDGWPAYEAALRQAWAQMKHGGRMPTWGERKRAGQVATQMFEHLGGVEEMVFPICPDTGQPPEVDWGRSPLSVFRNTMEYGGWTRHPLSTPHLTWRSREWSWETLDRWMDKERLRFRFPPPPRGWTVAHGEKWLNRLALRHRLSHVAWPWVADHTAATLWDLVCLIRQQARWVRTAVRWPGPVLGLNGCLGLNVGLSFRFSGIMDRWHLGNVSIACLSTEGDAFLPHEWAHALDTWWATDVTPDQASWASLDPCVAFEPLQQWREAVNRLGIGHALADWNRFRRTLLRWVEQGIARYHPAPDNTAIVATVQRLIGQAYSDRPLDAGLRVLKKALPDLNSSASIVLLATVWAYHHRPVGKASFTDHFYQGVKAADAVMPRLDMHAWFTDPAELWARAFEVLPLPGNPSRNTLLDPFFRAETAAAIQGLSAQVFDALRPHWLQALQDHPPVHPMGLSTAHGHRHAVDAGLG
jgi:hypothetical protein